MHLILLVLVLVYAPFALVAKSEHSSKPSAQSQVIATGYDFKFIVHVPGLKPPPLGG